MVFDNSMIAPGANYSAEEGCFEGPEKLLEIWFSPVIPKNENANLRQIERHVWDDMLATVKCTVLSIIRNPHADAYLLSESSMFVYPHKLMIKTCGATTLLSALPRILEIAQSYCGYHEPYRLFYSRKSFMFPEKQVGPHRSWDEEVNYLDSHFEHGSAYTVGDTNGDEWYLYMTTPAAELNLPAIPWPKSLLYPAATTTTTPTIPMRRDETIEILMTQLNPEAMEAFYHRPGEPAGLQGGRRVDLETGLAKVYPDAKVDSYLFEPCGYSANALLDEGYYTIHVTPEPQCSYASFETTIPASYSHAVKNPGKGRQHGYAESVCLLIRQVIDIFQPGTFTVTYFSSHNDSDDDAGGEDDSNIGVMMEAMGRFGGYKRKDRILYEFDGYDLVFGQYKKI